MKAGRLLSVEVQEQQGGPLWEPKVPSATHTRVGPVGGADPAPVGEERVQITRFGCQGPADADGPEAFLAGEGRQAETTRQHGLRGEWRALLESQQGERLVEPGLGSWGP